MARSLLRRLLLAESWRPTILDALSSALAAVPELIGLEQPPPTQRWPAGFQNPRTDDLAYAAVTAFSVLGGHLWCACPGARVSVASSDGNVRTTAGGTVPVWRMWWCRVLCGTGGRRERMAHSTEGARRADLCKASSRSTIRHPSQVATKREGSDRGPTWMKGYVALLPDDSASTPLGALLRSRALSSLQWLTEDRDTLRMLLRNGLFPALVASAVRPAPLESTVSREIIQQQLVNIEVASRELEACRRMPEVLPDRGILFDLMRSRGVLNDQQAKHWNWSDENLRFRGDEAS